ncbi:MAG: hypothetical protein AB8B56_03450 [Crocinitomicaceae bacterium]
MKFILSVLLLLPSFSFSQVDFAWVDSISGDFSFVEEWDYSEGVYVNQWGQLSCDGLCPMEIDRMKDEKGRVYDDSLTSFYTYVDTSHLHYSFEGSARVYEYGDCHYASASEVNGMIHIQTDVNIATHSSLHIVLDTSKDSNPVKRIYILYNSIRNVPRKVYLALNGNIELSKEKLKDGIVQLTFDLDFQSEDTDKQGLQHWEGKILTELES